ncbi:MAG: hypothetical protein DMD69_00625 [Gemmatimonadetes bacterium]|nr:MAG: hypothetical protein DMD69_00625 [Gemmatimonadota bacterium]PYP27105.1 MAG: hypothetical protein DMD55_09180 [Gemmatimonadota bacterium]
MLAAAVACGRLGPDLDRVVAISVADVPDSLEELDTLRPIGVALDGRGDPVPATILWATFDTALLTVVNDTTGVMVARAGSATPARIQASVGDLTSNPIAIRMLAAADTLFAAGPARDSVSLAAKPDSLSDSLKVRLQDTTATGPVDLSGRPVAFALTVYPGPGGGANVALVTSDTARAPVASDTVTTTTGIAVVKLRLLAGPLPDSAVVTAAARRAIGTAVPGSPITFVVRFLP